MLMAGYDTSSSAMYFLAYNLAVYKDCQEKIRKEMKEAIEQYVSCLRMHSIRYELKDLF